MLFPVVSSPRAGSSFEADREYRELVTSLRLLAGKDCLRDPSQAQVILVNLSESNNKRIAEDAQAILRSALAKNWFTDAEAKYYELERLAEKSIAYYRTSSKRARAAVSVAVVLMLLASLLVFRLYSEDGIDFDWTQAPIFVGILILALGVLAIWIKKR